MKKNQRKEKPTSLGWSLFVFLIIYAVILAVIMLWGVSASLKSRINWFEDKVGFPQGSLLQWEWENYSKAINNFYTKQTLYDGSIITANIWEMALNSIIYAGGSSLIATFCSCWVAYLTSKFDYKFSKIVYSFVIVVMVIPIIGSTPTILLLLTKLGLYQTLLGAYIMKFNFLDMYFLVFFAIYKGLSKEFSEAATIDGASEIQVFFKIMLPLVIPTFSTIFLIKFIELWNDYTYIILYLKSYPTLAFGVYELSVANRPELEFIPVRIAASILVALPILTLFIIFRNKIMGNVTMGGVKE